MEGKIVAAYQTPQAICYINDAAYADKSPEEIQRTKEEISMVVRQILERVAREDPAELERIQARNQARAEGRIKPAAVSIPLPGAAG